MRKEAGLLGPGVILVGALTLGAAAASLPGCSDPITQYDPVAGRLLPPGSSRYQIKLTTGRHLLAEDVERAGDQLILTRRGRRQSLLLEEVASLGTAVQRRRFLLGTDRLSRDCFARLLHGSRISLAIGCVAAAAAGLIGLLVGSIAALKGGMTDFLLMRTVDVLLSFPQLFLLLLLLSLFEAGFEATVVFLSLFGWMPIARIVRTEARALINAEFVLAARSVGQTTTVILRRHLLPHLLSSLAIAVTLRLADVMLLESALSFLGLGVQPPTPTLGQMIAGGMADLRAWWVTLFPGAALFAAVLGVNLIGDGLRYRLDPTTGHRRLHW